MVALLSRSWPLRLLGVTIVVILSVALSAYERSFYDTQLGLAKITFISRESRARSWSTWC